MLSERQSAIVVLLKTTAPEIGNVFEAGALLRNDQTFPARKYFVSHAAREIVNRLPDYYMGGTDVSERKNKPTALKELAPIWSAEVKPLEAFGATSPSAEHAAITISFELANKLDDLIQHEVKVAEYNRLRFANFLSRVQGIIPEQLIEIAGGFISIDSYASVHVPEPQEVSDEKAAVQAWDQLEERLFSLFGPRHKIYAEILTFAEDLNKQ